MYVVCGHDWTSYGATMHHSDINCPVWERYGFSMVIVLSGRGMVFLWCWPEVRLELTMGLDMVLTRGYGTVYDPDMDVLLGLFCWDCFAMRL